MGVALDSVTGTGPGGRIIKKNVLKAKQLSETFEPSEKEIPLPPPALEAKTETGKLPKSENMVAVQPGDELITYTRTRQVIADRMLLSKQTIPHFYLFVEADMAAALAWRKAFNQEQGANITITDLVVQATAAALREFPRMNAHVGQQSMVLKKQINIGIATAVEEGLLVPVIANTDQKDTLEISREIKQKAEDARKGKLDLHVKGTFTISSLGMYGIREFLPIINPPEAGILAIGKVEPKVVAEGHMFGVKNRMNLTLACDHRAVDGAYGAQFLYAIKEKLETANFKIFKR
jgi:pyruvate dehydrogenase E2 component (dihydrolipoamide acetyltransferase)